MGVNARNCFNRIRGESVRKRGMKPKQAAKLRAEKGIEVTKLQGLRVEKDLSQSDLAAISGVPLRRIQHYEQYKGTIDSAKLETLCALSEALCCKIEDILENKGLIVQYKKVK